MGTSAAATSAANTVSYRVFFSIDLVAAALSIGLVLFLRRQRTRAYLGKSALSFLVLLPIYEPVLWALAAAFIAQSVILMAPGPISEVPVWFTRAIFRESTPSVLGLDSAAFWTYNFVSGTMSEGFGIMLLHKFPSPEAFGSTLRYAALYAAVAASVATLGYNWAGLGLSSAVQDATDTAFIAVPCVLYAALLLQFTALTTRRSLAVYSTFCVSWRAVLICAIFLADPASPASAVICMLRNLATPLVMYYTLVRDTDYWYAVWGLRYPPLFARALLSILCRNGGAEEEADAMLPNLDDANEGTVRVADGEERRHALVQEPRTLGEAIAEAWTGMWARLSPPVVPGGAESRALLLEAATGIAAPDDPSDGGAATVMAADRRPAAAAVTSTANYGTVTGGPVALGMVPAGLPTPAAAPIAGPSPGPVPQPSLFDRIMPIFGGGTAQGDSPVAAAARGAGASVPGTPSKKNAMPAGAGAEVGATRSRRGSRSGGGARGWLIPHSEVHDTGKALGEGGAAQVSRRVGG